MACLRFKGGGWQWVGGCFRSNKKEPHRIAQKHLLKPWNKARIAGEPRKRCKPWRFPAVTFSSGSENGQPRNPWVKQCLHGLDILFGFGPFKSCTLQFLYNDFFYSACVANFWGLDHVSGTQRSVAELFWPIHSIGRSDKSLGVHSPFFPGIQIFLEHL